MISLSGSSFSGSVLVVADAVVSKCGCRSLQIRWTSAGHFASIRTVTDEADRQTSFSTSSKQVRFVELSRTAMSALLDGDLAAASNTAGVALTEYFVTDRARWLWRFRIDQMAADPRHAQWMVRQAVTGPEGVVIGHAGFHGPPDEAGMVEIGYAVAPDFRRQGYGRAILIELLRRAAAEPAVKTVRATISPDNVASLATIAGFGFVEVGEHWDEEDGLGLIFEVPVNRSR
ncbi:GNAT family protein [Sphaerisporangium sp. NPDC005288]|uniref:GNAT family N-acetyltransferase n=1 Tax=Sphaerisporangium sp. NPDC005288 TaxID=3155114 RepID=UPI0033A75D1C